MNLEVIGGKPLEGEIRISGAKNAAMKMIAAASLSKNEVELKDAPEIEDVKIMLEIFKEIGGEVKRIKKGNYKLCGAKIKNGNLNNSKVSALRGSIVFLGPLLARFKEVILPLPGGCKIGARPIDTHLKLFKDLGVDVKEYKKVYHFKFSKIKSQKVVLDEMSVTATENAILFASFLNLPLQFRAIAIEPEIIDLIEMLKKMGVKFKGVGTPFLLVKGNGGKFKKVVHRVIPDRIETGTWAVLAAISKGKIALTNARIDTLDSFFNKLKQAGAKIKSEGDKITIFSSGYFNPVNIDTRTYPGFPTDLQAPFSLIMTQAKGTSRIFETLFEDRLQYLKELRKMGANAKILDAHTGVIIGPTILYGKTIYSLDLRAGATLVLAALIAHGKSLIKNIEIIDRGYEDWDEKLLKIGSQIKRVP